MHNKVIYLLFNSISTLCYWFREFLLIHVLEASTPEFVVF